MDALISLFAGAIGWIAANVWLKPVMRLQELRGQVGAELIITGSIGFSATCEEVSEAQKQIRRLAGEIIGVWQTALPPAGSLILWLGWDAEKASRSLIGLSSALASKSVPSDRGIHRDNVERALRLPRSSPENYIAELKANLRENLDGS